MVTSRPTGNFRDIPVHPTENDLDHRKKVHLRANIGTGSNDFMICILSHPYIIFTIHFVLESQLDCDAKACTHFAV